MKQTLLTLTAFLLISNIHANQACSATYAAGMGHLLKGESVVLGGKDKVLINDFSQDEFYTFEVKNKNGKALPVLKETQTNKLVSLKPLNAIPNVEMYTTSKLTIYPEGVPGAFGDKKFIIVICGDESNF